MPNPFARSRTYARLGNLLVRPQFRLLPTPSGFALLTTAGRRSGRRRQQPVRAICIGDTTYVVSIMGRRSDWLRNLRANPKAAVKLGSLTRAGTAREISDPAERERAAARYAETVFPYDYVDYAGLYWGVPTRRKIQESHRRWLSEGVLVAIDLEK